MTFQERNVNIKRLPFRNEKIDGVKISPGVMNQYTEKPVKLNLSTNPGIRQETLSIVILH